jgi:hypothetical protein
VLSEANGLYKDYIDDIEFVLSGDEYRKEEEARNTILELTKTITPPTTLNTKHA